MSTSAKALAMLGCVGCWQAALQECYTCTRTACSDHRSENAELMNMTIIIMIALAISHLNGHSTSSARLPWGRPQRGIKDLGSVAPRGVLIEEKAFH